MAIQPLVSCDESKQMVTWVRPSFENGRLRRRAHFRVLPSQNNYNPKEHFDDQEDHRWCTTKESTEHRLAKELVAAELSRRLSYGLGMPWIFKLRIKMYLIFLFKGICCLLLIE